ncbi:ribonuclease P protein component [Mucilaginibacter segetis]|uniref:Ribonuclease P protein component n=1 Tax=Mucilaginibacter segetis TaxID=2793071 RepID=A0A934PU18_9SPHI|nr:ribonuclease P protein component [Mucilaginibacter segetis]MBK0379562.1 ribonuclease P protein component [Mucilaginibacter segetis]
MYTFKKEERLCNKRLIESLFHKGSSFLCYPFRVSWLPAEGPQEFPVQIVFSVSKRRYKRAVDRNIIKRRIREAYRLHKHTQLYQALNSADINIILSIGYIGKEIASFDFMEKKMLRLLEQLGGQVLK